MTGRPGAHAMLFLAVCALTVGLHAGGLRLAPKTELILLCVMVAGLGIPHGALDLSVARARGLLPTIPAAIGFLFAYLALAGGVVAAWVLAPEATFAGFLLISAYHFGGDWSDSLPRWRRLLAGAVVLGLPAFAHRDAVVEVFSALVPPAAAADFASGLGLLGLTAAFWLLLLALVAAPGSRAERRAFAELGAVAVMALTLPPLMTFTVYFCVLHSPRHLIHAARTVGLSSAGATLRAAAPLTVVAVGAAWFAYALLTPAGALAIDAQEILRVVFIGLAALTVPHMALVDLPPARSRAVFDTA